MDIWWILNTNLEGCWHDFQDKTTSKFRWVSPWFDTLIGSTVITNELKPGLFIIWDEILFEIQLKRLEWSTEPWITGIPALEIT